MRIVYLHLANPRIAGGQKVALRHVETLNDLGFEAVCLTDPGVVLPRWFEHRAPIICGEPLTPDDVVVVPEDGIQALAAVAASAAGRIVVICQNPYYLATTGLSFIAENLRRFTALMTVGPRHAAMMAKLFPQARIEQVRCFADERRFRPGPAKEPIVAVVPRKRPLEAKVIRAFHDRLRPDQGLGWLQLVEASETQVADAFARASVCLSLSRLESVGLTTLEAMASGCLCAGFTGVGGAEYATPENGFWAPEDDCMAAAEALAAAIDLSRAGGARRQAMIEAGYETARAWSYAVFRQELEAAWLRLAPEARRTAPREAAT